MKRSNETIGETAEERARALFNRWLERNFNKAPSEQDDHYTFGTDPFNQTAAQYYDILKRVCEHGWKMELVAEWRALEGGVGSV